MKAANAPAKKDAKSEKSAQAKPTTANAKGKLSYKQKYALETLPSKMDEITKKVAQLETKMADPAFFAKDAEGFSKAAKELEALQNSHTAMEEEWLELEMLREELEG